MRGVGFERQVAELVDDPQLRLGVEAEPLLEPAIRVSLNQAGGQLRRGDEQHRVALADRLADERSPCPAPVRPCTSSSISRPAAKPIISRSKIGRAAWRVIGDPNVSIPVVPISLKKKKKK